MRVIVRVSLSVILMTGALAAAATAVSALAPPEELDPLARRLDQGSSDGIVRQWQWLSAPSVDGRLLRGDHRVRHSGTVDYVLYELPRELDLERSFRRWTTQLERAGIRVEWQCFGRACGASNDWANGVYGEKRLYGLDDAQAFWTGTDIVHGTVVSLYLVRRGNQRVYARIEALAPIDAPEPRTPPEQPRPDTPSDAGWRIVALPGIALDAAGGVRLTDPDAFRDFRLAHAGRPLAVLIGASVDDDPVAALQASRDRAAGIRRWLRAQGIDAWAVMPTGPLLPAWNGDTVGVLDRPGPSP